MLLVLTYSLGMESTHNRNDYFAKFNQAVDVQGTWGLKLALGILATNQWRQTKSPTKEKH